MIITGMIAVLIISACGSTSDNTDTADTEAETSGSEVIEAAVEVEENEEPEVPFAAEDFVVEITPNGNIDTAGGVEYSFTVQNNSSIPVQEFTADVKLEFEDGQKMMETVRIYTTIMDGETVGDSTETVYPEPASLITSYEVVSYQLLDAKGIYYDVDLQLETIDYSDYGMWDISDQIPFSIEDFTVIITPNDHIDTSGGVEYAYEIHNDSEIPVKDISFDILMEFENGIIQVESISEYNTLMNGDFIGDSNETVYPEPAANIKSHKIIGYQITDKDNIYYDADTQLGIVEAYE